MKAFTQIPRALALGLWQIVQSLGNIIPPTKGERIFFSSTTTTTTTITEWHSSIRCKAHDQALKGVVDLFPCDDCNIS